ncbi:MAG TPA: amidase [Gemmatimonadaceae bacterium]|nr:amidase [Gemmatimonadaceae bacterium]
MDILFASATELAAAIRSRDLSAVEVLDAHLERISERNPSLNAIITMDAEAARDRARAADAALARGESWGPLHGVPFTLKDAHSTAGMRTTAGCEALEENIPSEDGTVAVRLKNAGGILIGKTNVPPLLDDWQSCNPIFGRTSNPWDVTRTPGGSSGGAAAAVASGMSAFDIGTDLSGSLRVPAHFCGVYGLKPTEHSVSSYGLRRHPGKEHTVRVMAGIGPIARSVDDLALIHRIIAGPDGRDSDVPPVPVEEMPVIALRDVRVAVAPNVPSFPLAGVIRDAVIALAKTLGPLCAVVDEPALPPLDYTAEGKSAADLISMMVGVYHPKDGDPAATLGQYMEALRNRDETIAVWERFFDRWDVLLCPAAMISAFPHCPKDTKLDVDGEEVQYSLIGAHTTLFNYTGQPAAVLPCAHDGNGLPIGAQLVAKRWTESRLLSIARAIAQVTGGFRRPPGH